MRCRKVRSFLSAYSHDELVGSKKLTVEEHLADCPACRKEDAMFRSLDKAARQSSSLKVSDEFNNTLLNRIAHERFAETRTKAYFPKQAPILSWGRVLPAMATVCVLVLTAVAVFSPDTNNELNPGYSSTSSLDDSYLTVQPDNNPNMTDKMHKNWSLDRELAKIDRINRISSNLQPVNGFNNSGMNLVSTKNRSMTPFASHYYRVSPVIRIYVAPQSTAVKEGSGVY